MVRSGEFEIKLRESLHQMPVMTDGKYMERTHMERTRILADREILRKTERERITFLRFLTRQAVFIGWKIWMLQIPFLLVVSRVFAGVYEGGETRYLVKLLACLSVLVLMTALPFIYRSVHYRMQEVEGATRFSSVRLLMAKLAMIGIGDLLVFGGIFAAVVWKTSLQAEHVFLSLCFPFLFAASGCLYMLGHCKAKRFFAGSMSLCTVCIWLSAFWSGDCGALAEKSFLTAWFVLCGLLALFCVRQFRYILYRSPYAEMQIT